MTVSIYGSIAAWVRGHKEGGWVYFSIPHKNEKPIINEWQNLQLTEAGRLTRTEPETAKRLGIGNNLAYEAVARDKILSVKVCGRILAPIAALDKMLESAGAMNDDQVHYRA